MFWFADMTLQTKFKGKKVSHYAVYNVSVGSIDPIAYKITSFKFISWL